MRDRKARRVVCWMVGCGVAACVPHLEPVEPIGTDRPDRTESATLVPAGMVQVEGGVTAARSGATHETSVGETLVRIGMHERLELRVEPFTHTTITSPGERDAGGVEDLAVGLKTPLLRPDDASRLIPEVSMLLASSLPTGGRSLRAGGAEPEAVLAAQWELPSSAGLGANVLARRGNAAGSRYWERGASLTLGLTLSRRAGSYVEWYATRDTRDPRATHVVNGGLTWKLTPNSQLDARLGHSTRPSSSFIGAGIATRW